MYLIGTLHEAREKVKLAEHTSDLSSTENTTRKNKNIVKNVEPPQYNEALYKNKQNGKYLLNNIIYVVCTIYVYVLCIHNLIYTST